MAVGRSKILEYMIKYYGLVSGLGAIRFLHDMLAIIDLCQGFRIHEDCVYRLEQKGASSGCKLGEDWADVLIKLLDDVGWSVCIG